MSKVRSLECTSSYIHVVFSFVSACIFASMTHRHPKSSVDVHETVFSLQHALALCLWPLTLIHACRGLSKKTPRKRFSSRREFISRLGSACMSKSPFHALVANPRQVENKTLHMACLPKGSGKPRDLSVKRLNMILVRLMCFSEGFERISTAVLLSVQVQHVCDYAIVLQGAMTNHKHNIHIGPFVCLTRHAGCRHASPENHDR